MNMRTLAALALLLGSSSAALAQTFEAQLADGAAAISRQAWISRRAADAERPVIMGNAVAVAQGAPTSYARTIFCATAPKDSGLPNGLRFYTGLDANPPKTTQADDTASGLDDYRSSYVSQGKYHYDTWSCDTQDYWFTFDAESLLKTTPKDASHPVKGHVRIETRGQLDWEGDLNCVANF